MPMAILVATERAIGIKVYVMKGRWGIVDMRLTKIDPSSDLSGLPYERLWDDGDVKTHARSVEKFMPMARWPQLNYGAYGLAVTGA